jgi:hypothetical protein
METKLSNGGVLTLEGAYYDYDTDGVADTGGAVAIACGLVNINNCGGATEGEAYLLTAAYLIPGKVGIGQFQPYARYQEFDPQVGSKADQWDLGVTYVMAGHNARITAVYSGDANNAAPDWWFEWTLGPAHVELADDVFVDAWRAFFHVLLGGTDSSSLALGMGPARRFVPPSTGSIPLGPSIVPPSASSVTQDGKSRAE